MPRQTNLFSNPFRGHFTASDEMRPTHFTRTFAAFSKLYQADVPPCRAKRSEMLFYSGEWSFLFSHRRTLQSATNGEFPGAPRNANAHQRITYADGQRARAERTGFEPAEGDYPFTDLANRRIRPLCHLSGCRERMGPRTSCHFSARLPVCKGQRVGGPAYGSRLLSAARTFFIRRSAGRREAAR